MTVKTLPAKSVPEPLSQLNFEALQAIFKEIEKQIEEVTGGAEPTGPAGGVLSGTYPNPGFAADMATQVELDAEKTEREAKDKTEKERAETAEALRELLSNKVQKLEGESETEYPSEKAVQKGLTTEKEARESADSTEKTSRESKDNERVVGPASATNLDVAVFDETTGKKIKDGGKTVAQLLERANHTGTQTASTISDLAAVVKAYLLSEFGKPGADVNWNEKKITKLKDPTEALDAANKEYVDAAASAAAAGLSVKNPVSYATTANITVEVETATTLEGECPLKVDDKEAFAEGTRLLLKDQTTKKQNGIFEVTFDEAFGGSDKYGGGGNFGEGKKWKLTRTSDADSETEVKQGMFVTVISGAINQGSAWVLQTENPIIPGTTNEEFTRFTASPTGTAGGDLKGTYPNPEIKDEVIVNKDVSPTAAIAYSKLSLAASIVNGDLVDNTILAVKMGAGNRWYGVVEALPTSPTPEKGDRCVYKAATGVYWELVYTKESEEYPWNKIGGLPLITRDGGTELAKERSTAETTPVATNAPSITTPLKMEYVARFGAQGSSTAAANAQARAFLFADAVEKAWSAMGGTGTLEIGPLCGINSGLTIAASKIIQTRYCRVSGSGTVTFYGLYIEVDPIRVG